MHIEDVERSAADLPPRAEQHAAHRKTAGAAGAVMAAGLGLLLVYVAGFAQVDALHNAAHDARHSAAFPCH